MTPQDFITKWGAPDGVPGPHNVLGIELNEYAAELARVTVWIGELQWRMAHGYEFKTNPVLEPLDHIECRDALLSWDSEVRAGQTPGAHALRSLKSPPTSAPPTPLRSDAVEADWPKANVVIGSRTNSVGSTPVGRTGGDASHPRWSQPYRTGALATHFEFGT